MPDISRGVSRGRPKTHIAFAWDDMNADGERQRSALTDSQPQKGFRQPAMQVLAELQVDRVTGRVGQGQNRQFEAPRRDWHIEPAPMDGSRSICDDRIELWALKKVSAQLSW
jgi:hypothetical protein